MKSLFAIGVSVVLQVWSAPIGAQDRAAPATRAYEDRQTFKGHVYRKDTNVWAYTREFADLFGMPLKYVDDLQGLEAAAFRVEAETNPECGFGGQPEVCRTYERCWLDMYFDEQKTKLPWATEIQSQWVPRNSSMVMLPTSRAEKPRGILEVVTPGVIRPRGDASPLAAFINPQSRHQASFITNAWDGSTTSNEPIYSNVSSISGYSRDIFRGLTVVGVQWGCNPMHRKVAPIHLASELEDRTVVRLHKMLLPEGFVSRINERLLQNRERDRAFNRSLFPSSMGGTKGVTPTVPATAPSAP
jgi:hypothetical protein